MLKRRRWLLIAIAPVLITAGVLAFIFRPTSETDNWYPEVRDSRDLNGPLLATGTLVNTDGVGVSGQIVIVAWVESRVLGALGPGDSVPNRVVGKTVSTADGAFVLRVDPAISLDGYVEPSGATNFELRSVVSTQFATFSFPRWLDQSTSKWIDDPSTGDGSTEPLDIVLELRFSLPVLES